MFVLGAALDDPGIGDLLEALGGSGAAPVGHDVHEGGGGDPAIGLVQQHAVALLQELPLDWGQALTRQNR